MANGNGGWTPARIALAATIVLIFAVAIAFRIVALNHVPGINGDEAYYGCIVMAEKAGQNPPWQSGSGLPLNPFYAGLLYLIHLVWPTPSFWLLRLPALLSGLALLALAYPLLARLFDRPAALATTLLLACLPIAIAYSRFGWDQSQTPLVALLCLYFAFKRQLIGVITAFAIAMIVHPLNIFLAPILVGPLAAEWMARQVFAAADLPEAASTAIVVANQLPGLNADGTDDQRRPFRFWLLMLLAGALLCVLAFCLMVPARIVRGWQENLLPGIWLRMINPVGWGYFVLLYADFLTGTTIFRYIAGPVPDWSVWLQRLLFFGMLGLLLTRGIPTFVRRRDVQAVGLLAGLGVSLAAFYLLLGPRLIGPALERYAMYLVTPSCLALVLLGRSCGETHFARRLQWAGLLTACGLLLTGFYSHYFLAISETGGKAHWTFRTATVEPKQAAFEAILAATDGQPAVILAEDWWCFQPIRYLAYDHPELTLFVCRKYDADVIDTASVQRRLVVSFVGGPCDVWLTKNARALPHATINDYAGQPVLHVWDLGTSPKLVPGVVQAGVDGPPDTVPE